MISEQEVLMGREKTHPLSEELKRNLADLLERLNKIRTLYGRPMFVSSGYRPAAVNVSVGGAKRSSHMSCQAADFRDPNGELAEWCLKNMDAIRSAGLYMEDPRYTKGWVHLQSRPTRNNPFIP